MFKKMAEKYFDYRRKCFTNKMYANVRCFVKI